MPESVQNKSFTVRDLYLGEKKKLVHYVCKHTEDSC